MDTEVGGEAAGLAGLVLRRERLADARAVAVAHHAAYRKGHAGILPDEALAGLDLEASVRHRRERLTKPDPDLETLVAEFDGTVVGHVTYGPDRTEPDQVVGRVWACYVHPDWWGRGVADALMRAALSAIPHSKVRLWMLAGNHRASRFYQRHGFQPDGARDLYRPPGWELDYPMVSYTLHRRHVS